MPHDKPDRAVIGRCPNCGESRIRIVLEGASTFFTSGPNEYYTLWLGRCCQCDSYLEAYFTDEDIIDELLWDFVEDGKVEFLMGRPPPTLAPLQDDPLWDPELDC
jgi:hypothetical protein